MHRANLNGHKQTHSDQCDFHCDYCSKAFKRKAYLQEHTGIHLGLIVFSCIWCQKRFHDKRSLDRHALSKHGNVMGNENNEGYRQSSVQYSMKKTIKLQFIYIYDEWQFFFSRKYILDRDLKLNYSYDESCDKSIYVKMHTKNIEKNWSEMIVILQQFLAVFSLLLCRCAIYRLGRSVINFHPRF